MKPQEQPPITVTLNRADAIDLVLMIDAIQHSKHILPFGNEPRIRRAVETALYWRRGEGAAK